MKGVNGMDAIVKLEFTQRLKSLFEEHGETIYTIAQVVSLSPSTISRYKNGRLTPKLITIEKLAAHFNVNPVWLMGYDVDREIHKRANSRNKKKDITKKDKNISKIIDLYTKMPEETQSEALDAIVELSKKSRC